MTRFSILGALLATTLPATLSAQSTSPLIQQIGNAPRVAPSASAVPRNATASADGVGDAAVPSAEPAIPAEILAACEAAEREDRDAPEDIDCLAVLQQSAEQQERRVSAEGSLLEIFYGQSAEIAAGARGPVQGQSTNADAIARDISSGDLQGSSDAALGAIRQRGGPPPGGPR